MNLKEQESDNMGCNRDSGCLKIANSIYPGLKSAINDSFGTINSQINDIISSLSGLSIPNDYLGQKVQSRVKSICSNFESDMASVDGTNSSINSFINQKIIEHEKHYRVWKTEQDRARQQKNKGNASDNVIVEK